MFLVMLGFLNEFSQEVGGCLLAYCGHTAVDIKCCESLYRSGFGQDTFFDIDDIVG